MIENYYLETTSSDRTTLVKTLDIISSASNARALFYRIDPNIGFIAYHSEPPIAPSQFSMLPYAMTNQILAEFLMGWIDSMLFFNNPLWEHYAGKKPLLGAAQCAWKLVSSPYDQSRELFVFKPCWGIIGK